MNHSPLRKLPIGIQSFEFLRQEGYLYVDKTALIYQLVTMGKPYFLSRPRRFGKSLLLSTLEAYFLGKRELFHGLAIEQLEENWYVHPVLHLSLNAERYDSREVLQDFLEGQLREWEALYGCTPHERDSISVRFMAASRPDAASLSSSTNTTSPCCETSTTPTCKMTSARCSPPSTPY